MASIERKYLDRLLSDGRVRRMPRYKLRYRDASAREHSETFGRLVDAERRKAEIEVALGAGTWHDPRRGDVRLRAWVEEWLPTRHDLRPTTHARLVTSMERQVLPRFGDVSLIRISNSAVRSWVADLLAEGLSAATVRKAVFALRQCLDAAVEDRRIALNPAQKVSEVHPKPWRVPYAASRLKAAVS